MSAAEALRLAAAPEATTLPGLLARNAASFPARVALREKARGIWHETTWAQLHQGVRDLALGLAALGFQRGDTLAVLAGNRPEWVATALAAQAAGGLVAALDPEAEPEEIAAALEASAATFVLAEDQRQVDHVLAAAASRGLPRLQRIVHVRARGLRRYTQASLLPLQALRDAGAEASRRAPEAWSELLARCAPRDLALVPCRPGPGCLSGAPVSARDLLDAAEALQRLYPRDGEDELVSFLPLCWLSEQVASVAAWLALGFPLNFPESPETVRDDLREIGPHAVLAPAQFWNDLHAWVGERSARAPPLKRRLLALLLPRGGPISERLLYRSLRDKLGLSRAHACAALGAAPSPEAARFFAALGLPVTALPTRLGPLELEGA